mmetsp:Transcript_77889/g.130790  ORF Transcript_77889/g.130790 Transcript_77889/m.130790 type:complete len:224 (-) Transcript_77889:276-947(-)
MRAVALSRPCSSISSECFRTKFMSVGSAAAAARCMQSSNSSTMFGNVSLKMPDKFARMSMRGLPSSSKGISSKRTIRPVPSRSGRAPTSASAMASDSPRVLIASSPHNITATVSGYVSCLAKCCSTIFCAAILPLSHAPAEGMRYGSRAWMLRPVGRTSYPSRSRSPPVAGRTYSPLRARSIPEISWGVCRSLSRIRAASLIRGLRSSAALCASITCSAGTWE